MNLQLPFSGAYATTQLFGENPGSYHYICRSDGSHNGIDYGLPAGTPVLAAANGSISLAGLDNTGYGLHVRVLHPDGTLTLYAHLSQISVTVNSLVAAGQVIGLSGSTGNATGPHLHIELRTRPNDCTSAVDPLPFLVNRLDPQPQPNLPPANLNLLFNVKVTATTLNIRSGPDTSYPVLRQVQAGDPLTIYNLAGQTVWVQVGTGEFCAFKYNGVGFLEPV